MNRSIVTWLLAGSLAASLSWNWRLSRPSAAESPACGSECASIDLAELELEPTEEAALRSLCLEACVDSDRVARQASALEDQLMAELTAPELDVPRVRGLAEEIGALRQRSLAICVEGILELRELLDGPEVEQLLARCALVQR
jgi:hypothetical protein